MSEWHAGERLAIFGARANSLGAAIQDLHDLNVGGFLTSEVTTFGPGRTPTTAWCDSTCDHSEGPCTEAIHDHEWQWGPGHRTLPDLRPYDNIVVTMGINLTDDEDPWGCKQMEVNYHGPMALARKWFDLKKEGHFVVISSNSAHIARSTSGAYCASKAALSMGIRAMARRAEVGIYYAWEFGLLEGTPMTAETARMVGPDVPLTRMRGLPNGIPLDQAAGHVYRALRYGWRELNGTTLRVDAGEQ